jgi:7,8-dihydropterin-6-yl-methyl-4-(beta-D-ribofuranosyl)aminobenzene 5'-phosphate synthase
MGGLQEDHYEIQGTGRPESLFPIHIKTPKMKISVLTENQPGLFTPAEHGLSYLIEYDGNRILFDTGQSDMFLKNAGYMNLNLDALDMIILSHGHYDHGNGLMYLNGGKLICHPGCFVKRYGKADNSYIGLRNTKDQLSSKFDIITSPDPYFISDRIIFLGEIPRLNAFESKVTTFVFEDGTPDFVLDDSALALIHEDGIFIVTGCGHAGIINILEHAKTTTGIKKIYGIMGGYHLKEYDLQTRETIKYLKKNRVKYVLPSHCTSGAALEALHTTFRSSEIRTGSTFEF